MSFSKFLKLILIIFVSYIGLILLITNKAHSYELPGHFEEKTVVRGWTSGEIKRPLYIPSVEPKCFDRMSTKVIPCPEKEKETTVNKPN